MSVFNEDTRVKIPATIQFLRIGYDYQSLREADIDFNTKIFVNRFKPALERINGREFAYDEIKLIINDIHAVIKNNDLGREFYNWLINPLDKVKLIDFDNIENNDFAVVDELPFSIIEGTEEGSFRPDINVLINGMPLAFLEVKKPNNDGGIQKEFDRMINKRLKNPDYRKFFNFIQFVSFSNNMEYEEADNAEDVKAGSFYTTPNGQNEVGKVIRMADLSYPFDVTGLSEQTITNVTLQKNDILFTTMGNVKPFLVPDEVNETVYVSPHILVLRCRDIQPEYLFLYLNSEVCQTILDSQKIGSFVQKITRRSVAKIPVIVPTKDEQEYKAQAYILTHIEKRSYQAQSDANTRIVAYLNGLQKLQAKKAENVEDVLSMELLETLKVHSTNQLQEMLHDDWKELNDCFRVGAYKATLILAGSILEAVLIDWLSEIKGHDYFTEDYVITDRNGRQKRADLIDYINEIKYIERPHWIDEATKAHEIRKKRNLVHAKLGINSDEINEETCRMVIDYLRDVIKTRGVEEQ